MRRPAILLILPLALAAACGDSGRTPGVAARRLENGAVLVSNPVHGTWTDATAWRAVEELRVGSMDGVDALAGPAALEVDALGRLYVLDVETKQVRVFDAAGRLVRSIGREGRGPAEFVQPVGMAWSPGGLLWVLDPGQGRFTAFDTTGAPRRTLPHASGSVVMPWPGRFDRAGRLYDATGGSAPSLLRIDAATGRSERLALPVHEPERFVLDRDGTQHTAFVPFSPRLAWALDGDGRVWSGTGDRYRLGLHAPGGDTLRIVERAAPPVPVSRAEREALPPALKAFAEQGGRVDLSRIPRYKPAFTQVQVDDRGYLWVRPSLPAGEPNASFDVFEPEGRYLGRVHLPFPLLDALPWIVRGHHLYAVVLSDAGYPQIVRLRLHGRTP
ncbi:MAG TPA: 6-bladed beta-propeller [Longimicrobium sp.]|nr:6-bladed beta-propeller [Longimicrobium sp.]